MEAKLKLELQLRVREAGVITGFCYPYVRLLLDKAIALEGQGALLSSTPANDLIFGALREQIQGLDVSARYTKAGCTKIIKVVQEFLAIFEE